MARGLSSASRIAATSASRSSGSTIAPSAPSCTAFTAGKFTDAVPDGIQQELDALAFDDTIPNALWEEMLSAGAAHAEAVGGEGRTQLAASYARALLSGTDFMSLFSAQTSLWDLLWFGLAISTAWKIMAGRPEPEPEQGGAAV